jgi:hypothetical protein
MVIVVKRKVTHAQFWLDSTQVAGRTPNDAGQKSAARRSPLIPSEPISGPCDEILEGQDQFCIGRRLGHYPARHVAGRGILVASEAYGASPLQDLDK